MSGTVTYLRSVLPECQAIGVDSHYSILFGHPDGHRELRGLGMSLMPANLDHTVFNRVHWCSARAAYAATRELHQRHALFMGPSSGAAYLAAQWYAAANPAALTVVMLPDDGYRYQDTVYNDDWLEAKGHKGFQNPQEPIVLDDPTKPTGDWMSYEWDRRSYAEVMEAHRDPVSGTR
jgi:cysteine synthase A